MIRCMIHDSIFILEKLSACYNTCFINLKNDFCFQLKFDNLNTATITFS